MRTISRTTRFKKDSKRESKGQHRTSLDAEMVAVLTLLVSDTSLPEKFHDHALTGEWKDHRDCHVKPDLVLIYRLPDAEKPGACTVRLPQSAQLVSIVRRLSGTAIPQPVPGKIFLEPEVSP